MNLAAMKTCTGMLFFLFLMLNAKFVFSESSQFEIKKVSYKNIVANLYLPVGGEKVPAIIAIGGSGGRMSHDKGEWLAPQGFAVLTLAYFKHNGLPETLDAIPIEYAISAIDYLETVSAVDSKRIGVIGASRGSELAFILASHDKRIKSVVATTPTKVAWHGETSRYAWKYKEKNIASLTFCKDCKTSFLQRCKEALGQIKNVKAAHISFEKIKAAILLVSAEADHIWPSYQMSLDIVHYLHERNFKFLVNHVSYSTNHFFNRKSLEKMRPLIINHFKATL